MTSDAERSELIALTELRGAIDDLATNRRAAWTRPGSREHDEQFGEQRAFERVLKMIDGRINNARKHGREPEGTRGEPPGNGAERLGAHQA